MRMAGPPQKSVDFLPSAKRLLRRMGPDLPRLVLVLVLAVASVGLNVTGPKLLGRATDFVVATAFRGQPLDRDGLRDVVLQAVAVYVGSAVLAYVQGVLLNRVVQRTVFRLRADVEATIHRLPLSHVDSTPAGSC